MGFVTVPVHDDTMAGRDILLIVKIQIVIAGTLHAGIMHGAAGARVIKERAAKFPNPVVVPLFQFVGRANSQRVADAARPNDGGGHG